MNLAPSPSCFKQNAVPYAVVIAHFDAEKRFLKKVSREISLFTFD
jgi:hypothetical protein